MSRRKSKPFGPGRRGLPGTIKSLAYGIDMSASPTFVELDIRCVCDERLVRMFTTMDEAAGTADQVGFDRKTLSKRAELLYGDEAMSASSVELWWECGCGHTGHLGIEPIRQALAILCAQHRISYGVSVVELGALG